MLAAEGREVILEYRNSDVFSDISRILLLYAQNSRNLFTRELTLMTKNIRTPILVWGDLISKSRPVVRRSLVGERAHECMYAWVYLTDYLVVKRISKALEGHAGERSSFFGKLKSFASDRNIDPHFQHNLEAWTLAGVVAKFISLNEGPIEVAELGQTFFSLKTKVEVLSQAYPSKSQLQWTGIDNSPFAVEVAKTLHGESKEIAYFDDWRKFQRFDASQTAIFTSRFVSSYAFENSDDFVLFLKKHQFELVVLEEPFNACNGELLTFNHGLPICYFDMKKVSAFALANDYEIEIVDWYPDNPAKSGRCLNTKMVLRKKATNQVDDFSAVSADLMLSHAHTEVSDDFSVALLLDQISPARWREVDRYKFANPVWSKTPIDMQKTTFVSWMRNIVTETLLRWKSGLIFITLRGKNVRAELLRHVSESRRE
jgi:hypothetical protein|tara:strand:- start:2248 stop:3534 length:1287 start_codon:yes stop_codon:yes gene_type:complete